MVAIHHAKLDCVGLVFALSVVKVQTGGLLEGYDHQPRVSMTPVTEDGATETTATEEAGE